MKRINKITRDIIIYGSIGVGILSLIPIAFFFLGAHLMGW